MSELLYKLEHVQSHYNSQKSNASPEKQDTTFLTGTTQWDKVKFSEDDVKLVFSWKAHNEAINCVTWIKELYLVGSCSYDCNVYLWGPDGKRREKI